MMSKVQVNHLMEAEKRIKTSQATDYPTVFDYEDMPDAQLKQTAEAADRRFFAYLKNNLGHTDKQVAEIRSLSRDGQLVFMHLIILYLNEQITSAEMERRMIPWRSEARVRKGGKPATAIEVDGKVIRARRGSDSPAAMERAVMKAVAGTHPKALPAIRKGRQRRARSAAATV